MPMMGTVCVLARRDRADELGPVAVAKRGNISGPSTHLNRIDGVPASPLGHDKLPLAGRWFHGLQNVSGCTVIGCRHSAGLIIDHVTNLIHEVIQVVALTGIELEHVPAIVRGLREVGTQIAGGTVVDRCHLADGIAG